MEINVEDLVYDMIAESLVYPHDSNASKYYNELIKREKYGWIKELRDKIKAETERIVREDESYKIETAKYYEMYAGDTPVITSACAEYAVKIAIENIKSQDNKFTL